MSHWADLNKSSPQAMMSSKLVRNQECFFGSNNVQCVKEPVPLGLGFALLHESDRLCSEKTVEADNKGNNCFKNHGIL